MDCGPLHPVAKCVCVCVCVCVCARARALPGDKVQTIVFEVTLTLKGSSQPHLYFCLPLGT